MAQFKFVRVRFYPDLDLEVSMDVRRYDAPDLTARGTVTAKGSPGARQRWRDDFWKWVEHRNIDAVAPRFGNRRIDGTSVYDCYLKDWQMIADFIVMWVGVDNLTEALADRAQWEDRVGKQMRTLTAAVENVGAALCRIEDHMRQHNQAWDRLRSSLTP